MQSVREQPYNEENERKMNHLQVVRELSHIVLVNIPALGYGGGCVFQNFLSCFHVFHGFIFFNKGKKDVCIVFAESHFDL